MVVTHPLFPNRAAAPSFVLDGSVTLAWVLPRSTGRYADDVLWALLRTTAVVSGSWLIHLAELVRRAEQQSQVTPAQSDAKLAILRGYPIAFDDETDSRAWADTLALARAHGIGVFDAAYLELAVRLNLPLATTDPSLLRAAGAAGVTVFTP